MNIAMITGASSGMGREFAVQLAKQYPNLDELWLIGRDNGKLKQTKEQVTVACKCIPLDLESEESLRLLTTKLSTEKPVVRFLINAAGFGKKGNAADISLEDQTGMVNLNIRALTHLCLACLPYMKAYSRIINVASASAFCPQPGFSVYAASKSYVLSFSRSLGHELQKKRIYVLAVCPGPVDTAFFDRSGTNTQLLKKLTMAKPDRVVRQAIKDCRRKKAMSVYGVSMKLVHVLTKVCPKSWMMATFQ